MADKYSYPDCFGESGRRQNEPDRPDYRPWPSRDNTPIRSSVVPFDSYDTTPKCIGNVGKSIVVSTSSPEETKRQIANVTEPYDPNPEIIRQAECGGDVQKYEQKVCVRYHQPPAPEPGTLTVERKYCLLPPLVINEEPAASAAPPTLVLRERPPTPPPSFGDETTVEWIHARPIIIQYLPAHEKPRDVIIDRWLPYGPPPPRRRIVKPPTGDLPRIKKIECMTVKPHVVQRIKTLCITDKNPRDYMASYGGSLLDSATLVQMARNAGVREEHITPPAGTITCHSLVREFTVDRGSSYDRINPHNQFSDEE